MKKTGNFRILLMIMLCVISVISTFSSVTKYKNSVAFVTKEVEVYQYYNNKKVDSLYLSDIDYIANMSFTRWDKIRYDEVSNGSKITVKIENNSFTFDKGIWAHATSQVTYDVSELDYKYFTAFIGLNTTAASSSNGVKFRIYTSQDGKEWIPQTDDILKKPGENATFIKVDISDAVYLRLIAGDNGSNGNDHAVYADAKLVNEVDESSAFTSVEEYDDIIKTKYANHYDITGEFEFTLLKRELVKNVGQYTINSFYNASEENKEAIDWLMNNQDILRYYILGGKPDGGSYYNSLTQLSRLYKAYKEDFKDKTPTNNKWYPNLTKGEVYQKMAISLSLTHSTAVGYWAQINHPSNRSDALNRYVIFKDLYDRGKFVVSSRQDHTPWFEALNIEEMRYVMNNITDDEELLWLNEYTQKRIDAHPNQEEKYLQPHTYIAYVWPNFQNPIFHDPARKDYWDEKFEGIFSKYGVTYSSEDDMVYKAWMTMRNEFGTGAVCGGISKLGTHIRAAHGTPASVISQPGHAAIIYYRKLEDGRGYWTIDNDVSGWAQSGKTERLGIRMPLGWGNDSYVSGWAATYIILAQEAMNDWESYEESEKLIMLADVYKDDKDKKEECLRKALKEQSINIDAWWELIKLYNSDNTKTEEDYYNLAVEMGEALLPFPLPLYNLYAQLKGKFTSTEYTFKFTLLQSKVLNDEKNYTETDRVVQPSITRTVGKFLLGQTDTTLATFSFDGDNGEKIVLSNRFDNTGIRVDYSLDGKKTWNEVPFSADEKHTISLTKEEIGSITAENDIYVHIVGTNYSDENLYKIDITEGTLPKYNGGDYLYGNDLENRVVGVDLTMEWRMNEDDEWKSYKDKSPDLTGNKSVQVRVGATGTKLPSSYATFTFTEDNQPENRKYIPVSHLTIESVSSEATSNLGAATYAIDGNYNTRWHSAWNGSDTKRFITVKLDKPVYLSAVEFVPAGGGNGKIYDGTIYGSMDGENWEIISQKKGLTYSNQANTILQAIANTKAFEIEEHKQVQYVKIVADRTNGNWFTARNFNFYQDITQNPHPTAGIGYSATEATNQDVVARLVNPSTTIKITNNDGKDTYTFTENGEFTFEFIDEETGLTGSATAKVDWIDKEAPTGKIIYSPSTPTNKEVVAKLVTSEDVTIISGNQSSDEDTTAPNADPYVVIFSENGEYTFEFKDKAGNIGTVTAKVIWIDRVVPTANVKYSTLDKTKDPVTVFLTDYSEKITITNNDGKDTYTFTENGEFTFEFVDEAGNIGSTIAKVDWINKEIPTAEIKYSEKNPTNNDIIVTLVNPSKKITITNNDGKDTYIFTKNGKFTFEFVDEVGNKGTVTANVDWIDKEKPTAEIKYENNPTINKVIASLVNVSEEIIITNNSGKDTYTFTENGEFTFEFIDKVGNKGTAIAKVDWITKEDNKNQEGNKDNNLNSNKPASNEQNNTEINNKPSNSTQDSSDDMNESNKVDKKPEDSANKQESEIGNNNYNDSSVNNEEVSASYENESKENNTIKIILIIILMILVIIISETRIYKNQTNQ